ncbi:MAG: hypothetical protein ACFFAO_12010 [Candidatus Hermodarchaeota archaeon]
MPNSEDSKQEDSQKIVKNLENKISEISSILQKFGLDLITKLGQTNSKIKMLTDKIDKLDKTTIDIKALLPKLTTIIDNQNIIDTEIDLIKSLIQRSSLTNTQNEIKSESIDRDESITKNKAIINDQFKELMNFLDTTEDIVKIKENLQKIREKIFELIGGHKILYEISQAANKLNNSKSLTENLKDFLKEKIIFWMNKL